MPKIVFLYPSSYQFSDSSYENEGVGGSEASLILLTRALARLGADVHVYLPIDREEVSNGVSYHSIHGYRADSGCDVFVLFRHSYNLEKVVAERRILWSTDGVIDFGSYMESVIPYVTKIIGISTYHKNVLARCFPKAVARITYIPLGVTLSEYARPVPKNKNQAIFCSVAGRGLPELLSMASRIAADVPGFKLVVTSDYSLWRLGSHPLDAQAKILSSRLPFVEYCGKLPRAELVRRQLESEVMAYPCTFDECFCISAMECMAAGAVPVVSCLGALPETVGSSGVFVSGVPGQPIFDDAFVASVTKLLLNSNRRAALAQAGRASAARHDWDQIGRLWYSVLGL